MAGATQSTHICGMMPARPKVSLRRMHYKEVTLPVLFRAEAILAKPWTGVEDGELITEICLKAIIGSDLRMPARILPDRERQFTWPHHSHQGAPARS